MLPITTESLDQRLIHRYVIRSGNETFTHPLKSVYALCDLSKFDFGQGYFHHLRYDIIHTIMYFFIRFCTFVKFRIDCILAYIV